MRRFTISAAVLALSVMGSPAGATDGSIGLYLDPSATITHTTLFINQPTTLYFVAHLEGATAGGGTGFEFRATGLPAGWLAFVAPNPTATLTIGDPLRVANGVHRANLAFSSCQPGMNGLLLLYTVMVIPTSVVTAHTLTIEAGDPPTDPSFTSPIVFGCDAPNYSPFAVTGVSFTIDTVRAPQDLDYSLLAGFDGERGVQPVRGHPGDVFRFRVAFSSSGRLLAAGQPVVQLDANGDGDSNDTGEGAYVLGDADLDSTLADGKDYVCDVALAAAPAGNYRYRFSAIDSQGQPVPGRATAWNESLFVSADLPDLVVHPEDVTVGPSTPDPNSPRRITVRFTNASDVPVRNAVLRVEDALGNPIVERTLAHVSPRGSGTLSLDWTSGTAGFQILVVRLDPTNAIAESDESNNVASHGLVIAVTTTSGDIVLEDLNSPVSMAPLQPFRVDGTAHYVGTVLGVNPPAAGARVQITPSWDPSTVLYTDVDGDFALDIRAPAAPGSYSIGIAATDGARTSSASVQLNVAPTAGLPHGPNLVPEVALVPPNPCAGGALAAHWSVRNTGDQTSGATTARLEVDGVSIAADLAVGALAPGASQALPDANLGAASPGLHWVMARVDPANSVPELRDDDGARWAAALSRAAGPDLGVDSLLAITASCSGMMFGVDAWILNHGCAASAATRVVLRENGAEVATASVRALASGELQVVRLEPDYVSPGCHSFEVVVDPDSVPGADTDAARDVQPLEACLAHCTLPPGATVEYRVTSCDLGVSQSRPVPGETIRFTARVRNSGYNAVEPVAVRFYLDGSPLGADVRIGPIPFAGARTALSATWPADFVPHQLHVVVDPADEQPETDPNDNQATAALPYQFVLVPLESCPPASPSMFSSCGPCAEEPVSIRAVPRNLGLFDADSVRIEFRDTSAGNALLGTATAGAAGIGDGCQTDPQPVSIVASFGTTGPHIVRAIVDPGNAWPEYSENDNQFDALLGVTCSSAPDLTVSFVWPRDLGLAPGDTLRGFDLRVSNSGTAGALDVRTNVLLNGQPLCTGLLLAQVPAHGSGTVRCTTPVVVPDPVSSAQLQACVDPDDLIHEVTETNNCATSSLPTGWSDLTVWLGLSNGHPSAGEHLLVYAHVSDLMHRGATASVWFFYEPDWGGLEPFALVPVTVPPGSEAQVVAEWIVADPQTTIYVYVDNVEPADYDLANNWGGATIPVGIGVPVVLSDLAATSSEDGVQLRWKALPVVAGFLVERREGEAGDWVRLTSEPIRVATTSQSEAADYQYLDATATPGAHLEYRVLGVQRDGASGGVLGTVRAVHDAARMTPWLHAVQPNPFRAGGVLRISVPRAQTASLCVYDAAGRRIAVPWSGVLPAGRTEVRWDGTDAGGRAVRSGVYFLELRAGGVTRVQRLVLVR